MFSHCTGRSVRSIRSEYVVMRHPEHAHQHKADRVAVQLRRKTQQRLVQPLVSDIGAQPGQMDIESEQSDGDRENAITEILKPLSGQDYILMGAA